MGTTGSQRGDGMKNTEIKRTNVPEDVQRRIWGRSAARCVLCARWLVDQREYWHAIPAGQIAHVVAAENGSKAPRGQSTLDSKARSQEENLLLLCGECHKRIDSKHFVDKYTVEFLTEKKNEHERWVREVTNFARLRPAIVVRMTSTVRGTYSPASNEQVGEALREAGLTGMHADSRTGAVEISVTGDESDSWIWDLARKEIATKVARVHEAIAAGDSSVIAVFGIASIPMLIALGAELDDKTETFIFRRDPANDGPDAWVWPTSDDPTSTFELSESGIPSVDALDVIAFVGVSAEIDASRVPADLAGAPSVRLSVSGGPSRGAITTRADLQAFSHAWSDLLTRVETQWPSTERLHILSAVPTAAAITIGRLRMRTAHPTFVLYQLQDGTDSRVMEVVG